MTIDWTSSPQANAMRTPSFGSVTRKEAPQINAHPPFLHGLPDKNDTYLPQQEITKALQSLIDTNQYQGNFVTAIGKVAAQNINELKDIVTLDQFYFYVDALVTWIPEVRVWEVQGNTLHERTVYLRIVQFYYYFNQDTLQMLQSPIAPGAGENLSPLSRWLRDFAVAWGAFLDTEASNKYLESFKYAPEYALQDFFEPSGGYKTFNEFFARTFDNIVEKRPVAQADDDRVIVFPAESTFVGQWTVSTASPPPLELKPSVVVKHIPWAIEELLADSDYAADFAGGRFCHSFLNTYDYHRLHTPVAGKVLEARFVPGQVYLEVGIAESDGETIPNGDLANAVIPKRALDASDSTGYQFVQCRGLLVLDNEKLGKVAVLPMGMAQVSSVVFTDPENDHAPIRLSEAESSGLSYDEHVSALNKKIANKVVGRTLAKGEMFSMFQFGGSDCVVVFERKANVNVTAQVGTHYPIRSQYAQANY